MLLAVLEKRCKLYFSQNDVFLNLAGGIKVTDPAIDLSILAALISSLVDIPIDPKICFAGEIGLSGEVRAVNRIEQRIQEAARLGFAQIFISKYHKKVALNSFKNIEIKTIGRVEELVTLLFT
jgi:DNA repair protein RadA/Sms